MGGREPALPGGLIDYFPISNNEVIKSHQIFFELLLITAPLIILFYLFISIFFSSSQIPSRCSSVEDLKSKFCSTVANDIMLVSTMGVIRMWADEASRKSRFRILFTTYQERKS